ncbi:MAG: TetR/AcrR family transcriptional regulator [Alkalispirochaeta sp.]
MAKEHGERRDEIITTAQALFFSLGYEACTINDIIQEIGIAKGTFYHYFRGKQELLEALIEQMSDQILAQINAIAADTTRSAADRLSHYFQESLVLKAQSPELMVAALETLYRPENMLLRVQMFESSNARVAPVLARLIREGTDRGEFNVSDPALCGEYIIRSFTTFSDKAARMILENKHRGGDSTEAARAEYHRLFDFMEWAIARLLGVEAGTITLTDRAVADSFFDSIYHHRAMKREDHR